MRSNRWKIVSMAAASSLMGFCIATGQSEPSSPRAPQTEITPPADAAGPGSVDGQAADPSDLRQEIVHARLHAS